MRGFSFSNFDAKRRRKLAEDIKSLALVKLGISAVLFLLNPFLGIWVGTAGLMLGGLAGGVRLSGAILRPSFRRIKNTGFRVKVFRQARVINRARAYRRGASRAAVAGGGKDSGDGGSESDSGDPPGPDFSFPVTLFQKIYRKPNSLLFPWRALPVLAWRGRGSGCWRLLCHAHLIEEVAA